MAYTFEQIFAADPSNQGMFVSRGVITIFAPGDTSQTPIKLTTVDGRALANPITVNEAGYGPAFMADLDRVAWAGGGYTGFLTSYDGMKDEAVSARKSADASRVAAEEAARNSAAPTQEAVAQALATDGPARTAVDEAARAVAQDVTAGALSPILEQMEEVPNQIAAGVAPVRQTISAAADPFAYFDSMKLLCEFPVRESGEMLWPQGFSLDVGRDRIYVTNHNGAANLVRIDVRQLSTGKRLESKTFTGFPDGSWSESCPWFLNGAGDLCFVVYTKITGVQTAFCVVNYTTGSVGPAFALPEVLVSTSKADVEGGYFIVAEAGANTASAFVAYTWESIKAGSPVFVSRVVAEQPNGGVTFFKNQGLGIAGGNFFLIQGAQSEHPAITIYDKHGRIKEVRSYPKPNFGKMVNRLAPEKLKFPQDTFFFEAEGGTNSNGRLISGMIIGDNTYTGDSRYLILEHGHVDGEQAVSALVPEYVYDTGWINLEHEAGWTSSPAAQIRRVGNEVTYRGQIFNATQEAGGFDPALKVPQGMRPPINTAFPTTYNATPMAVRVDASGAFRSYTGVKTGVPRYINSVRYYID